MSNSSTLNEVVLRPRFKFEKNQNNEYLLGLFDKAKKEQDNFIVSRIDNHFSKCRSECRTFANL